MGKVLPFKRVSDPALVCRDCGQPTRGTRILCAGCIFGRMGESAAREMSADEEGHPSSP